MELYPIERRHGASEQTVTSSEAPVEANDVEIQCVVPEANTGVSHNTDNDSSPVAMSTPAAGTTVQSIEIETSPASSMNFTRLPVALAALVLPLSSSSPSSSLVGDASTNNGSSARANVVAQEARSVEATSVTVATPAANVPGAATVAFAESVVCGDEEEQGANGL
jgi:pectin methylesterase-like acyl-CoA thioesterase